MRLFVAPRTGSGTRADPYRPDIDRDEVGGEWGAYEMPDGTFTVCAPNADVAPVNTTDLGNDIEAPLPPDTFTSSGIGGGTGTDLGEPVDVSGMTVGEAILTLDGNITPDHNGRVKITLCGVDLYDAPAIQGGATDSFTYSNGALSTVSSGAWVVRVGAMAVTSGTVINSGGTGTSSYYWSTPCTGQAQYSELVVASTSTSWYSETGVTTRAPASTAETFYYAYVNRDHLVEMYKATSGTYGQLSSVSVASDAGTIKLESSGSTHTAFYNGTSVASFSDSALTGLYVGIQNYQDIGATQTGDNWVGGDIGGGGTSYALTATGTGTSTGSLAVNAKLVSASTGTGTSTGSLAVGVTAAFAATGTGTSTGSLAVTITAGAVSYTLTATGNGTTAGSLAVGGPTTLAATGTGATTGSLAVGGLGALAATGTGATTGSLAVAASRTLTASGTGASTGTLAMTITSGPALLTLAATGYGTTTGHLAVASTGSPPSAATFTRNAKGGYQPRNTPAERRAFFDHKRQLAKLEARIQALEP